MNNKETKNARDLYDDNHHKPQYDAQDSGVLSGEDGSCEFGDSGTWDGGQ